MPKTLKLREFLRRLRDYGVIEHPKPARGKGSEVLVIRPNGPDPTKGPLFPLTCHGRWKDVSEGLVLACLRRFGIDKDEFFEGL